MNLKNFLRTIGFTLLTVAPVVDANAAQLSADRALARVRETMGSINLSRSTAFELSYTEKADGVNMLYVFNAGNEGFIIASADDRLPAKLGYSDAGDFDFEKASPELKWWLEQYAEEAAHYLNNENQYLYRATPRDSRPAIDQMLTTLWDQGEPYNLYCPTVGNYRSVTGCVATAMAQVIKYHNYPVHGTGVASYQWGRETLSYDYGEATFNYDEMLDTYSYYEPATDSQNEAVANLMYACGVGVNMDYSPDESGAGDLYIAHALKTYFNYDAGVRYLKKMYYTNSEWEDMVYAELEAHRPVIYSGKAPDGGHAFVCDGYEDGYFHINWGWSGMGNGYFLLSALDPGLQGVGGFAGGYNSNQTIISGIKPADGNESTPWYHIYATGGLEYSGMQGNFAVNIYLSGNEGIYNYSPDPVTVEFYLKAESESGEVTYSDRGVSCSFSGAQDNRISGIGGLAVYVPQGLPEGKYKATLVIKTPEGNWQDVLIPLSEAAYMNMYVDAEGIISFTDGEPSVMPKLRILAFAPVETVISGEPALFNISLRNEGEVEYSGTFYAKIFAHDTDELIDQLGISVSVAPEEEFDGWISVSLNMDNGLYDLVCYDKYNNVISEVFPLWIGLQPVVVTGITLDQTEAEMEAGSTLQLTATIIPEDANNKTVLWTSSDPEIANVDENGIVTAFNVGEVTITATSQESPDVFATCIIKVNEMAGIEDVMMTSYTADIYSIDGLVVKTNADREFISALPHGVYILLIDGKAYKITK